MKDVNQIWDSQIPTGEVIIKTRVDEIPHFNCTLATNHITGQHLYIMSFAQGITIPELRDYKFKGVEIYSLLDTDSKHSSELYIYLIDLELKEIFALFIQNILEEICECVTESQALNKTINVITKWRMLFDKMSFGGLSPEKQKGLIGELLFFNYLLERGLDPNRVLEAWTGADYEDKDFTFGSTGIEIKFTSSKNAKVKISSERQLELQSLENLYLILYTSDEVKDNGISLYSIIEQTRSNLPLDSDKLNFNAKLALLGYRDEDKNHYGKLYSIKKSHCYQVESNFPRIIESQLDQGLHDVSYSIELSALEHFIRELEVIIDNIQ